MSEGIENDTIFLVGAAASLPAGILTTCNFAEELEDFIRVDDEYYG